MRKEIINKYREWRSQYRNHRPDRAIVRMKWDDEDEERNDLICLKMFDCDKFPSDDDYILYYVSGLRGLLSLTEEGNGSGFVVKGVEQFYKHKD